MPTDYVVYQMKSFKIVLEIIFEIVDICHNLRDKGEIYNIFNYSSAWYAL